MKPDEHTKASTPPNKTREDLHQLLNTLKFIVNVDPETLIDQFHLLFELRWISTRGDYSFYLLSGTVTLDHFIEVHVSLEFTELSV